VAMALSILIFSAMPYLDRSRIPGGGRYRPVYRAMFYLFVIDVVVLGYVGAMPTTPTLVTVGQIATFMYFAMFLLLPYASRKEERWLRARGLPKAVQELLDNEAASAKGDRK